MKIHDVEQGTAEWLALRLGIPTTSEFKNIVTAGGKPSASARKYAHLKVAEKLLGRPLVSLDHVEIVQRGKGMEPQARRYYEFDRGVLTRRVGFVTTDDGRVGCSPDSLVGNDGLLEIKCPAPQTHTGYLVDGIDKEYRCQLQGQLLITERPWVDFFSYSDDFPEVPGVRIRVQRDEPFIRILRDALDEFNEMREAMLARALAAGAVVREPKVVTPHEADARARGGRNLATIIAPTNPVYDEDWRLMAEAGQ